MKQMRQSTMMMLTVSAALAGTACRAMAQELSPDDLNRIREATKAFQDITAAHAVGFPTSVPGCLENRPQGGMGHHYIHPKRMDDRLEVERPEILVYAPTPDGGLKLAGVEYVVPYSAWSRAEAPTVLDRDLKRSDQLQLWYLHVWVWEENSKGMFADWNPAVRCSPRAGPAG